MIVIKKCKYCRKKTIDPISGDYDLSHLVVCGPLDDLLEDGGVHVGEGDHLLILQQNSTVTGA